MPVCCKCGAVIGGIPDVSCGDARTAWECHTCFHRNLIHCKVPDAALTRKPGYGLAASRMARHAHIPFDVFRKAGSKL